MGYIAIKKYHRLKQPQWFLKENGLAVFQLEKSKRAVSFFFFKMIPKGVFNIKDYMSSIIFFMKVLRYSNKKEIHRSKLSWSSKESWSQSFNL